MMAFSELEPGPDADSFFGIGSDLVRFENSGQDAPCEKRQCTGLLCAPTRLSPKDPEN